MEKNSKKSNSHSDFKQAADLNQENNDANPTGQEFDASDKDLEKLLSDYESSSSSAKRIKLAEYFNVDLKKPKQTKRIKSLYDQYQYHLNKSQSEALLYTIIIENSDALSEIYSKQRAQIKKVEQANENVEFLKARLAFIINRYRVRVEKHKKLIEEAKVSLDSYKESVAN